MDKRPANSGRRKHFSYRFTLAIISTQTGVEIAYIAAPYAYDNSPTTAQTLEEKPEQLLEPGTKFFITLESGNLFVTTAVSMNWLLDDSTSFPVVIDPNIGTNTYQTDSPGTFKTCVVVDLDCHTITTGEHYYSLPSRGGLHVKSPIFDFTFPQTSLYSIEKVTAVYEYDSVWSAGSGDYGALLIMEDCGGPEPFGNNNNLNAHYNPSNCTNVPLPAYVPPTPPANVPVLQQFTDLNRFAQCDNGANDVYSTSYPYDLTSDMTQCSGLTRDFITSDSFYENGGIFDAGSYNFFADDSYGDGLNGATIGIQVRTVADPTQTPPVPAGTWEDQLTLCESGTTAPAVNGNPPVACSHGTANPIDGSFTVANGYEARLAYECPGTCWPEEVIFKIISAPPAPIIPSAVATGTAGTPTGSEAPSLTFVLGANEEAYLEFTSGNSPGDADNMQIYYRTLGDTGWSNYWDICYFSQGAVHQHRILLVVL